MHWNRGTKNSVGASLPVTRLANWLVCAAVVIGLAPIGWADTVQFATGAQTLGAWVMEKASAGFDINGNRITAQSLDLSVNQFNVNQAICFPCFSFNGATGILIPTIEPSDTYAAADATLTTNTSAQWIIGSGVTYIVGNGFPTFD